MAGVDVTQWMYRNIVDRVIILRAIQYSFDAMFTLSELVRHDLQTQQSGDY